MIGKFFHWLDELTHMISEVIDECMPKMGPLPSEKWWWSPELSARYMVLCRLTRRAYSRRSEPGTSAPRATDARSAYGALIEKAKREHWRGSWSCSTRNQF